jgi:hypothetical protein
MTDATFSKQFQDLNFKVSLDLRRAFKVTAAYRNIPMKELLDGSFRCWLAEFGDETLNGLLPDEFKFLRKRPLQPRSGNELDC